MEPNLLPFGRAERRIGTVRDGYAGMAQERQTAVTQFYLHAALNLGARIAMRAGSKRRRRSQEFLDAASRAARKLGAQVNNLGQVEESGERRRLDQLLSILGTLGISFASERPPRVCRAHRRKGAPR